MKLCSKCKLLKNESEFSVKKNLKLKAHCISCSRVMVRNHYQNNKEYYRKRNQKRKKESKKFLIDFLQKNPCVDCGERDPVVLEFDHIDPKQKTENVSWLVCSSTLPKIKEEIKKCVVRCANCHKRRTAKQFRWHKSRSEVD